MRLNGRNQLGCGELWGSNLSLSLIGVADQRQPTPSLFEQYCNLFDKAITFALIIHAVQATPVKYKTERRVRNGVSKKICSQEADLYLGGTQFFFRLLNGGW